MPTSLSNIPAANLRKYKLTAFLVCSPLFFFAQSLTGLWTGALSNDSTTVRKDQLFEIALTEYKGKVYGYSRSEFIVNDTLYYIVKRVKGTIEGDICEVTDDEIIAYNFRGKLDKGIRVTSTFRRNGNDSAWYLAGTWKTNATKKYYSVTGKVDLGQEKDLGASKIFPHLEELKLAEEIAFYKERNQTATVAKIARPQRIKTEYSFNNTALAPPTVTAPEWVRTDPEATGPAIKKADTGLARTETKSIDKNRNSIPVAAPELVRTDPEATGPAIKKTDTGLARTETKSIDNNRNSIPVTAPDLQRTDPDATGPAIRKTEPVAASTRNQPVKEKQVAQPAVTGSTSTTSNHQPLTKSGTGNNPSTAAKQNQAQVLNNSQPVTAVNNHHTAANNPVTRNTGQPTAGVSTNAKTTAPATASNGTNLVVASSQADKPAIPAVPRKSMEELTQPVAVISGRKSEFSQVVNFRSDSLVLSLYDNGEIDGDTVSVIMNGETIMARQGLKASAIRKTIYVPPGQHDDFTLVLFADNLGKYPPNTGLLVVHDGEDTYHLRFSSDFQKSSGIVFRRKQ